MNDSIFSDIEKAADADEERKEIDLGPISALAKKQAMMEHPADDFRVKTLYGTIKKNGLSVADVEAALKMLKKDLFQVSQVQIPELMKEFGLDAITTNTGVKIEVKDGISVSVRDQQKLFAYVRENDSGDLIKNSIVVQTDTTDGRKEVLKLLENADCFFEEKEVLHPATLKKFIKDGLEKGNRPDDDVVNIYEYRFSKIKK